MDEGGEVGVWMGGGGQGNQSDVETNTTKGNEGQNVIFLKNWIAKQKTKAIQGRIDPYRWLLFPVHVTY